MEQSSIVNPSTMWLKLGNKEILNLTHVSSIRKGENNTIEIRLCENGQKRVLPFDEESDRDRAFDGIINTLEKLGMAIR